MFTKKQDPFEILKQDHRKVEKIFEKLENTTSRAVKTRKQLFKTLKEELEQHTKIEEKYLYPVLEEYDKTHFEALESEEEHHLVDILLKELKKMDVDDEKWMAKLTVLKENVLHHVEEEEKNMFPKAKKMLSDEEYKQMGKKVAKAHG